MGSKRITVLCGVSGVGKTHYRQDPENHISHLPCVDIAEIRNRVPFADWGQLTVIVAASVPKSAAGHVVIEGYFLPDTPSRALLEDELGGYEIENVFLHASQETCERRLLLAAYRGYITSSDAGGRIAVMRKCWGKADVAFSELTEHPRAGWTLIRTDETAMD
jgi:hypothetical protein